jgi:hypothetical protein
MNTRTDIHRPSSEQFDPEAYQCVGVFDLHPEAFATDGPRRYAVINNFIGQGYTFTGVWGMGSCDHCGNRVRYTALLIHPETKGMIWVGETCLADRFETLTKAEFRELRESARLNRERRKRSERVAELVAEMTEDVRNAYEWALTYSVACGLTQVGEGPAAYYVGKDWEECTANERSARRDGAWRIADDIASKLEKYTKPLSEKQTAFMVKAHGEYLGREAKKAQERLKIERGEIKPCPTGRVQITGTILSVKWVENDFGGTYKMLVQDDSGFKVYGTVPASLPCSDRGTRIQFTATVQPSKDDIVFGIYSRPTKAQVIEEETETAA